MQVYVSFLVKLYKNSGSHSCVGIEFKYVEYSSYVPDELGLCHVFT